MGRIAPVSLTLVALGGCAISDEDDGGAAATRGDGAAGGGVAATMVEDTAGAPAATAATADAQDPRSVALKTQSGAGSLEQLAGPSIAIEAQATMRTDDVHAAVDRVTDFVVRRGGRVASADIDFAPDVNERGSDGSRATLVLAVPPVELPVAVDHLDDLGTVVGFDQLAEDVTEQLVDLDSRIDNTRASVERVRALLDEATDIEGIVRLESELTDREIELERLLASQRQLEDRVAMSTLTLDVVAAPQKGFATVGHEFEPRRPSLVEALGDGWGAFVTGGYAVVLAIATVVPFVLAAAIVVVAVLLIRRMLNRSATTASRQV
jgi:Domain of unknown function (DUF4349)